MKATILLTFLLLVFHFSISQTSLQFSGPFPAGYYHASGGVLVYTIETKDGNLLTMVNGGLIGSGTNHILNLTKRDDSGIVLWSYNYSFINNGNYITGMEELPDSGFMFSGISAGQSIFFRLDKSGTIQYAKCFGNILPNGQFYATGDVQLLNDSVMLISGEGQFSFLRTFGYVTLDLQGNILNQNFYHTSPDSAGNADTASVRAGSIIPSIDGGYLLVYPIEYYTVNGPLWTIIKYGFRLTKTDASGNILWAHEYSDGIHGFDSNPIPVQILEMSDSTIIISTECSALNGTFDRKTMLARMDASGNIIWANKLDQFIRNVQLFKEGPSGFIVTGMYYNQFADYINVRYEFDTNCNLMQSSAIDETQLFLSWESMNSRTTNNSFISTVLDNTGATYFVVKSLMQDTTLCDNATAPLFTTTPLTFNVEDGASLYNTSLVTTPIVINQVINPTLNTVYCTVSAMDDLAGSNESIAAVPNPVSDFLTIKSTSELPATIILSDVSGRIIFSSEETLPAQINMSGFHSGYYFCKIFNSYVTRTFKVIKK